MLSLNGFKTIKLPAHEGGSAIVHEGEFPVLGLQNSATVVRLVKRDNQLLDEALVERLNDYLEWLCQPKDEWIKSAEEERFDEVFYDESSWWWPTAEVTYAALCVDDDTDTLSAGFELDAERAGESLHIYVDFKEKENGGICFEPLDEADYEMEEYD